MTSYLGVLAFILACLCWLFHAASEAGEDKVKREALEDAADDIYTAKQARERIDADPDYANKLREKYTRD